MHQNSNFRLPGGHRLRPKLDFTVMAPNHGGDTPGSILGPMGSNLVHKIGQTIKNYHAPKFEFSTTLRSSISTKIRLYGYGAKSRWGPPRVHLGANGVPLGKIMGQNREKLPCPKIRIFDYPALIDFGLNSTWRLWRQIMVGNPYGPSWGQWGAIGSKKWVKTVKKLPFPKIRIFGHRFRPKFDFTVMAPNHGGDPLGAILGPMGSSLGPKNGSKP